MSEVHGGGYDFYTCYDDIDEDGVDNDVVDHDDDVHDDGHDVNNDTVDN